MPKNSFLDKLIARLDSMDPRSVQTYILRIAREKGFLETVFNAIMEGVLVVDRKLRIKYHNAAAKEMLGLPDELSRLRISNFLKGVDWRALLKEDVEAWSKASRQELEILYPERRVLQFYLVPHNDGSEYATLILNDVTESRERAANDADIERRQLVSMLAAGVAHEIGNPLNSLYLNLQLLLRTLSQESPDTSEAKELVSEAKNEVERLDAIINQFLRALRPAKPDLQPTDLKEMVIESLTFMRKEIEDREVKVECSWPDPLPKINGDAAQLKQAFYNLVKNALQAMPKGGSLSISCAYDDDAVNLRVADSGCGISPDDMPRIFTPYYSTKKSGSGLGLMIVERIAKEHGA